MDLANIIGITAIVVALVGVIVGVLGYLRMNPKRRVEYQFRVVPLIQRSQSFSNRIAVSFDGENIPDPHLVEVQIRATGRVDIRSDDFDSKKPLRFHIGRKAKMLRDGKEAEGFSLSETDLLFHPTLIPRKAEGYGTQFLCQGMPEIHLVKPHPIADTAVKNASGGPWVGSNTGRVVLALVSLLMGMGVSVVSGLFMK
ncbi:hypothetical protein [Arthrobacter sp.]|uniref:hypothetical protein n=1 Tax=Arthrobacter sp. TaxID=1667 RepID=UPI003A9330B8